MTSDLWNCPFCGFELHKNATSCPQCGSDKDTGWATDTYVEEVEHDYEAAMQHEFELHKKVKKDWKLFLATILILALIVGLVISSMH